MSGFLEPENNFCKIVSTKLFARFYRLCYLKAYSNDL